MTQQLGDKLAASVRGAKQQQAAQEKSADTKQPPKRVEVAEPVKMLPSRRVWPD